MIKKDYIVSSLLTFYFTLLFVIQNLVRILYILHIYL